MSDQAKLFSDQFTKNFKNIRINRSDLNTDEKAILAAKLSWKAVKELLETRRMSQEASSES